MVREEATSALAGFPGGLLSLSSWNLEMLLFVEGWKLKNPYKNPWSLRKMTVTNIETKTRMACSKMQESCQMENVYFGQFYSLLGLN